jgi:hypothetical protein
MSAPQNLSILKISATDILYIDTAPAALHTNICLMGTKIIVSCNNITKQYFKSNEN